MCKEKEQTRKVDEPAVDMTNSASEDASSSSLSKDTDSDNPSVEVVDPDLDTPILTDETITKQYTDDENWLFTNYQSQLRDFSSWTDFYKFIISFKTFVLFSKPSSLDDRLIYEFLLEKLFEYGNTHMKHVSMF
jgi:hypothetical protein